jgi:hypothetical protein
MVNPVGAERDNISGILARAAFIKISEATRPLNNKHLSLRQILLIKSVADNLVYRIVPPDILIH